MPTDRPLARSLARIDATRDWLEARIRASPIGWLRADRVGVDAGALEVLRRGALETTGQADDRSVGIMMMWRYADVAGLGVALFRDERRVPDLDPAGVAFVPYTATSPTRVALASARYLCLADDPDAAHPDATPVPDLEALRDALVRRIEAFIEPVIEPLAAVTHLGPKALWGVAASATLAGLARSLADTGSPERAAAEVGALLRHARLLASAPPVVEVVESGGAPRLLLTLGICCRAYLWPGRAHEKCATCPIRPRDDRVARQLAPVAGMPHAL